LLIDHQVRNIIENLGRSLKAIPYVEGFVVDLNVKLLHVFWVKKLRIPANLHISHACKQLLKHYV